MEWRELPRWLIPDMMIDTLKRGSDVAFLDSSDNVNPYGQYSILGFEPFLHLIYKNGKVFLKWSDGERGFQSDLWGTIRDLLAGYRIRDPFSDNLPAGAAIGYLSYDLGMELERVKSLSKPALGWPLLELTFFDLHWHNF